MRGPHDVGGLPAGPVPQDEHDRELWEKRIDALVTLLAAPSRGLYTTDASRRIKEALPERAFETMSYYERWTAGLANLLIEQGTITSEELAQKMAQLQARFTDA
jgi:hypothetical protein